MFLRWCQGPWGFTIVWPEGVIFGSIMTYHVQFLLLVRQPFVRSGSPAAHTDLMGASDARALSSSSYRNSDVI